MQKLEIHRFQNLEISFVKFLELNKNHSIKVVGDLNNDPKKQGAIPVEERNYLILDFDYLKNSFHKKTGLDLVLTHNRLTINEHEEMILKNQVPFDYTSDHDLIIHVLPIINCNNNCDNFFDNFKTILDPRIKSFLFEVVSALVFYDNYSAPSDLDSSSNTLRKNKFISIFNEINSTYLKTNGKRVTREVYGGVKRDRITAKDELSIEERKYCEDMLIKAELCVNPDLFKSMKIEDVRQEIRMHNMKSKLYDDSLEFITLLTIGPIWATIKAARYCADKTGDFKDWAFPIKMESKADK